MPEIRELYEIPVHILQEFIIILRANQDFVGKGKIRDYYLIKDESSATIMYDNNKVCFICNFAKDDKDNWFFLKNISIRDTLKFSITEEIIKEFGDAEELDGGLALEKSDEA